ncbi:MAG: hypothetical protein GY860_09710 [Desulfobacteraceae bacterium]|nr:hypothetical protein [Desulfobacteraceae bacterium]
MAFSGMVSLTLDSIWWCSQGTIRWLTRKAPQSRSGSWSAECKAFYLFDCDRHSIFWGKGAGRVHRAIVDFLESIE